MGEANGDVNNSSVGNNGTLTELLIPSRRDSFLAARSVFLSILTIITNLSIMFLFRRLAIVLSLLVVLTGALQQSQKIPHGMQYLNFNTSISLDELYSFACIEAQRPFVSSEKDILEKKTTLSSSDVNNMPTGMPSMAPVSTSMGSPTGMPTSKPSAKPTAMPTAKPSAGLRSKL